jgi:NADPH2:quinone reductase
MRAVVCSSFGPLDGLRVEDREDVACGARDVRVRVTAAGVNFVDGLLAQGLYQIKPPLPFVPGNEVAGVVTEAGADAGGSFAVGDRVFANVGLGGFVTEIVLDSRRVNRTPAAMSDGQAATFTQSYMTAWFALHERARAKAGQWLLVLGAGGGVGLAAVDVGRAMGLRVIAAASTDEKRAAAQERGAEVLVDTTSQDPKAVAREVAGGGVDLVYDPIGGELGENALRALGDDGQFLVIGFASGAIPKLPANQVLLRNRRVTGVDWGGWVGKHQEQNAAMLADVLAAIERGELSPAEPTMYAMEDAARALTDQVERRVVGKVALAPA